MVNQSIVLSAKFAMKVLRILRHSHWLNCPKECNWWVHARCANIHYENTDKVQRQLDMWGKDHFYCEKHMPRAIAIGWDKEKEQDVVIQEPRKQRFFKGVQKLVSQKKKIVHS